MVPREVIERIKSQVNIVELVSEYVSLQRVGSNYRGLCPFHTETTPSFYVSPSKNLYHCFGCGASGDVVKFIQEIENISYAEAIRKLAERIGVELEFATGDDLKPKYLEFYKQLHGKYRSQLSKHPNVVAYLRSRGFDDREISLFEFGYAEADGKLPLLVAQSLSLDSKELEVFGFPHGDPFSGRITIPIKDDYGRVVAFGARLVGDGAPKYINSQDTPFFKKSYNLFLFNESKDFMKQLDYAVVCEGYFDAIAFHRAGIRNAVATLGTSLSRVHASKIKRHTTNIVLAFDRDKAGVKATLRSLELLLDLGFNVMIAQYADGKDADEVFRKHGRNGLLRSLENAVSPDKFVVTEHANEFDLANPNGVSAFLNQLRSWAETFRKYPSLLDGLVRSASDVTGLPTSRVANVLTEGVPKERKRATEWVRNAKNEVQGRQPSEAELGSTHEATTPPTLEDYLVFLYFNYPEDFKRLDFSPDVLQGRAREFFLFAKDLNVSIDQLSKDMGSFVKNCLDKVELELDEEFLNALQRELNARSLDKRIKEIDELIQRVQTDEEKRVLLRARIELVRQRERTKRGKSAP